jgi:Fe-S-cluster containining protein
MKNKCENCGGLCCLDTQMLLSKDDVNLILKNYPDKLKKEDFIFEINRYFQLKNINGHCVFFDSYTEMCKIYKYRPQGCRFYPLIYDKDKETCIFDEDCPRNHLFYKSKDEFETICKKIKEFIRTQLSIEL